METILNDFKDRDEVMMSDKNIQGRAKPFSGVTGLSEAFDKENMAKQIRALQLAADSRDQQIKLLIEQRDDSAKSAAQLELKFKYLSDLYTDLVGKILTHKGNY